MILTTRCQQYKRKTARHSPSAGRKPVLCLSFQWLLWMSVGTVVHLASFGNTEAHRCALQNPVSQAAKYSNSPRLSLWDQLPAPGNLCSSSLPGYFLSSPIISQEFLGIGQCVVVSLSISFESLLDRASQRTILTSACLPA